MFRTTEDAPFILNRWQELGFTNLSPRKSEGKRKFSEENMYLAVSKPESSVGKTHEKNQIFDTRTLMLGSRNQFPFGNDNSSYREQERQVILHIAEGVLGMVLLAVPAPILGALFSADIIQMTLFGLACGWVVGRILRSAFPNFFKNFSQAVGVLAGIATAYAIYTVATMIATGTPLALFGLITYGLGSLLGYVTPLMLDRFRT